MTDYDDVVKRAVDKTRYDDAPIRGGLAWATLGVLIRDHPHVKEVEIQGTEIAIDFKDGSNMVLLLGA